METPHALVVPDAVVLTRRSVEHSFAAPNARTTSTLFYPDELSRGWVSSVVVPLATNAVKANTHLLVCAKSCHALLVEHLRVLVTGNPLGLVLASQLDCTI